MTLTLSFLGHYTWWQSETSALPLFNTKTSGRIISMTFSETLSKKSPREDQLPLSCSRYECVCVCVLLLYYCIHLLSKASLSTLVTHYTLSYYISSLFSMSLWTDRHFAPPSPSLSSKYWRPHLLRPKLQLKMTQRMNQRTLENERWLNLINWLFGRPKVTPFELFWLTPLTFLRKC